MKEDPAPKTLGDNPRNGPFPARTQGDTGPGDAVEEKILGMEAEIRVAWWFLRRRQQRRRHSRTGQRRELSCPLRIRSLGEARTRQENETAGVGLRYGAADRENKEMRNALSAGKGKFARSNKTKERAACRTKKSWAACRTKKSWAACRAAGKVGKTRAVWPGSRRN
ncbi:MAG: uncharacterized protein A8A55_2506 [Amphiamblys sp. WSBS2006]|nr:MAG: uncharacterized protein A8A55_2506 [Amphiamblys sp. WSBS2006]